MTVFDVPCTKCRERRKAVAMVLAGLVFGIVATMATYELYICPYEEEAEIVIEGDDSILHRMCETYRHTDPEWWEAYCKI